MKIDNLLSEFDGRLEAVQSDRRTAEHRAEMKISNVARRAAEALAMGATILEDCSKKLVAAGHLSSIENIGDSCGVRLNLMPKNCIRKEQCISSPSIAIEVTSPYLVSISKRYAFKSGTLGILEGDTDYKDYGPLNVNVTVDNFNEDFIVSHLEDFVGKVLEKAFKLEFKLAQEADTTKRHRRHDG